MSYSLFVVRDSWEKISPKAQLIIKLFKQNPNLQVYYIIRDDKQRFLENWDNNQIHLATSTSGILFYYFFAMLRSPEEFKNRISRRIFKKKVPYSLMTTGFITVLSKTLNHYFASSARSNRLRVFLKKTTSKKFFLIDEFTSTRTLNTGLLKRMGTVIYVSQDVASENFDFYTNFISRNLMYKLERDVLKNTDLVIACSERDKLRYMDMGAKKACFYPNIYPIKQYEPFLKDEVPSISIAFQSRWGNQSIHEFDAVFDALSKIKRKVKVYVFGMKPKKVPSNVEIKFYGYIADKLEYLKILSKSWIGINIGIHHAGSNERKYDYALAGLVVFSDTLGCRGEILLHEYTFLDNNDLAAKLNQFLELSIERITEMGNENRRHTLMLAEKQLSLVSKSIKSVFL